MTRTGLAERFWSHVDRSSADGCWLWTGSLRGGYGQFRLPDGITASHRMAWELEHEKIPTGMYVCHTCDNRPCCRPSHLFLGTQRENIQDAMSKGRVPQLVAPGRHAPFDGSRGGEENPASKLTSAEVSEIRERAGAGETFSALGREFEVTGANVSAIVHRRTWKDVP